ncbi:helix-turn-helix domain-containing protein [Phaeodactylibacter xiamenensis]|uniref:helix-turn-helix domain-containing protein n=1 Tax=Phaeodactylibacter xiamenensis TaxID=1524460 RepID=UPI0024A92443|nr:helix-turn-helix domain-containing protein [Phaeodactylibacter xiamenensis]
MNVNLSKVVREAREKLASVTADLTELAAVIEDVNKQGKPGTEIIGLEEMCDILQVSMTTARRYHKDGKLEPSYRKGKQIYWLRSELKEVLRNS